MLQITADRKSSTTTLGNAKEDKIWYFKNRVQEFWHGIRLGKFRNIDDLLFSTQELINLAEDMDMIAEMKEWRGTEKKLAYIKEEFGYDNNAWNYVRNVFGDKGSLGSSEKLEINRDIAKIARIHLHTSVPQGIMGKGPREMMPPFIHQREFGEMGRQNAVWGPGVQMNYDSAPGRWFKTSPKAKLCFECGDVNHIKRDCPFLSQTSGRGRGREGLRGGRKGGRF